MLRCQQRSLLCLCPQLVPSLLQPRLSILAVFLLVTYLLIKVTRFEKCCLQRKKPEQSATALRPTHDRPPFRWITKLQSRTTVVAVQPLFMHAWLELPLPLSQSAPHQSNRRDLTRIHVRISPSTTVAAQPSLPLMCVVLLLHAIGASHSVGATEIISPSGP